MYIYIYSEINHTFSSTSRCNYPAQKMTLSFVIIVIFFTVTTVTVTGNGTCDVNNFRNKQAYSRQNCMYLIVSGL